MVCKRAYCEFSLNMGEKFSEKGFEEEVTDLSGMRVGIGVR